MDNNIVSEQYNQGLTSNIKNMKESPDDAGRRSEAFTDVVQRSQYPGIICNCVAIHFCFSLYFVFGLQIKWHKITEDTDRWCHQGLAYEGH